ncbi:MAG: hypothetical protein LAP13_13510 [Acidobacteriia bacterium]|nr:hypothetical protein [Terriglobia bacterium]
MKRNNALLQILMMALALLAFAWPQGSAKAADARRTLKVKLNYTGAGVVDEKHKIYVMLFDANPYKATSLVDATSLATPPAPAEGVSHILARQGAAGKDKTVTFRELNASPVYAAAFFDRNGTYDGHADAVSGAPMGVYGKLPDKLEPIKIKQGKTVQVVLSFDDSSKSP